jgi:hypothetical protein
MLIQMLETRRGCEDGFNPRQYEAGKSYDVADMTARSFLRSGWAKEVTLDSALEDYKKSTE